MMQDGLHIGLGAWIHEQGNSASFAAYPSQPAAIDLVELEAIQDVHDLAKAAEFARLVNFIPRQGQIADIFGSNSVLWDVHRNILGQMDFANQPWTSAEQAEYEAARNMLYVVDNSGLPSPSQQYLLYQEMRNAYEDLVSSGGTAQEIAQAMTDWVVLGHKQDVEDAFEVITRLSNRSSRTQAEGERLLLSEDPPGLGLRFHGDLAFAPTYFAPISALSRETWMEAKVSFADLNGAVGDNPVANRWRAYRANRQGEVTFSYVVLSCLRPWYSPGLYQADDWKLSPEDSKVSQGNGSEGLLPAYVDTVYLAAVNSVTHKQPPANTGTVRPRPRLLSTTLAPIAFVNVGGSKSLANLAPRSGVVKGTGGSATLSSMRTGTSVAVGDRPLSSVSSLPTSVGSSHFVSLRRGTVRRVTAVDLNRRYLVAQAYLGGTTVSTAPSPDGTPTQIYVVGFGCEKIPFAPNPNVNYQWS